MMTYRKPHQAVLLNFQYRQMDYAFKELAVIYRPISEEAGKREKAEEKVFSFMRYDDTSEADVLLSVIPQGEELEVQPDGTVVQSPMKLNIHDVVTGEDTIIRDNKNDTNLIAFLRQYQIPEGGCRLKKIDEARP